MQLFLYSKWLSLPINVRIKIANQFGIQKKGSTEVVDNQIKSDGYVIKEIEEALNIDALQNYIGTQETDMLMLWMWLVEKIEGKELSHPRIDTTLDKMADKLMEDDIKTAWPPIINKSNEDIPKSVGLQGVILKPRRGRPKKNAQ